MNEVKIIVRETDFFGMEEVLNKTISAIKTVSDNDKIIRYKVTTETLCKNGADKTAFPFKHMWTFMYPFDIVEEVEETK